MLLRISLNLAAESVTVVVGVGAMKLEALLSRPAA